MNSCHRRSEDLRALQVAPTISAGKQNLTFCSLGSNMSCFMASSGAAASLLQLARDSIFQTGANTEDESYVGAFDERKLLNSKPAQIFQRSLCDVILSSSW